MAMRKQRTDPAPNTARRMGATRDRVRRLLAVRSGMLGPADARLMDVRALDLLSAASDPQLTPRTEEPACDARTGGCR